MVDPSSVERKQQAERRVSIAQLLFDHDPSIGEAGTDRPIHRGIGRRHTAERADHHPEALAPAHRTSVRCAARAPPALPARLLRIGRTERCRVAPIIDRAAAVPCVTISARDPAQVPPPSRAAWQGRARRGRFPAARRAAAAGCPSTTPPIGAAAIGRVGAPATCCSAASLGAGSTVSRTCATPSAGMPSRVATRRVTWTRRSRSRRAAVVDAHQHGAARSPGRSAARWREAAAWHAPRSAPPGRIPRRPWSAADGCRDRRRRGRSRPGHGFRADTTRCRPTGMAAPST